MPGESGFGMRRTAGSSAKPLEVSAGLTRRPRGGPRGPLWHPPVSPLRRAGVWPEGPAGPWGIRRCKKVIYDNDE